MDLEDTRAEFVNPSGINTLPAAVRDAGGYPTHLIARLLYSCGLRVSDPLNLRIKDLDLQRARV